MFGILIAVRNFTIAVLLAWMGFSVAPDSEKQDDSKADAPNNSVLSIMG